MINKIDLYPITIIKDRYSGTYSDGLWIAFNCSYEQIPSQVGGSDTEEMWFWNDGIELHYYLLIGKGNSPDEALSDLYNQYLKGQNETMDN